MKANQERSDRIDAALSGGEEHRRPFQGIETPKHEEWKRRPKQLNAVFDGVRNLLEPPMDMVISRFGDTFTATPTLSPSTRDIVLHVQSPEARIRVRFQATRDQKLRKPILNDDLELIRILMQYDSHAAMEMPLHAIDHEAVVRWTDDRIMSFVQTYIAIHEYQFYPTEQMVMDPACGARFPMLANGAKLEREGRTQYFISKTMQRAFENDAIGTAKWYPAAARVESACAGSALHGEE